MPAIAQYREVQAITKAVLAKLGETITATDTERSIAARATKLLYAYGISQTWYHNCPAFVLLGSRSRLSISGRDYQPSSEKAGHTNLITVDLSPALEGVWGDCARSFFVEYGRCVEAPSHPEFVRGAEAERKLHAGLRSFATPTTTFRELFEFSNEHIHSLGFENLDFQGNLGHSIETNLDERRYIELDDVDRLDSVTLFTFEPHIRELGGVWGFKHENIYCFCGDELKEL